MRTIFIVVLFFCCLAQSSAQLGIRGGYIYSDASVSFEGIIPSLSTSGRGSFSIGFFHKFNLGTKLISVQPEVTYMGAGYQYETSVLGFQYSYRAHQVDAGVLLRINYSLGPIGGYLGAGPFYTYDVTATVEDASGERDVDFDIDPIKRDNIALGFAVGFFLDAHRTLFIEGRYIGELSNTSELLDREITQRSYLITGGFMF